MTLPPTISIIIPVLNDASALDYCLTQFTQITEHIEIIIVDGGSRDDTLQRIKLLEPSVKLIPSQPGRGQQLHAGATIATGQILLFLHSDTVLPRSWQNDILQTLQESPETVGYFLLQLAAENSFYRWVEKSVQFRSKWLNLPYGDQAYFMQASTYQDLGGFKPLALMEDVEFIQRASSQVSLSSTTTSVSTSARNWAQDGKWKRAYKNLKTLWSYKRGKDINRLGVQYQGIKPALSIFCKKPEPGKVKTRLAKSIGRTQAAELYRHMTEDTLREMSRLNSIKRYVTYTPPENYEYFYKWLGPTHSYLPQPDGDLGQRMLSTAQTLESMGHTHILIIGTDCPDLNRKHIGESINHLHTKDLVIIPSYDGGYTLIGMKAAHATLFEDIAWSTDQVIPQTLQKASEANLTLALMEPLNDIDTIDDL